MLVRPIPLPDEIDRSYLGAVMRCNGLDTEYVARATVAEWAGFARRAPKQVSWLELLSRLAGMEVPLFVRQHTTLPLRRGITSHLPQLLHGSLDRPMVLSISGMRLMRPAAYFCADCVAADQYAYGRSYWRREHQTPGHYACRRHHTGLRYVESEPAFFSSPSRFLYRPGDDGGAGGVSVAYGVEQVWADQLQQCKPLKQFMHVCSALMESKKPFDVRVVQEVLKERAKEVGFQTYPNVRGPRASSRWLSDEVLRIFPREWIALEFPDLAKRTTTEHHARFDSVLWATRAASSSVVYALAASVLFDAADAAIDAFLCASGPTPPARPLDMDRAVDDKTLVRLYVAQQGDAEAIGRGLLGESISERRRLDDLGLPRVRGARQVPLLEAAYFFFVDERPIQESAQRANVAADELEHFVRRCGSSMKSALVAMRVSETRRPAKARTQPRALTPRIIGAKVAADAPPPTMALGSASGSGPQRDEPLGPLDGLPEPRPERRVAADQILIADEAQRVLASQGGDSGT